jgi:IPT/TIG domain-containing protein
MTRIVPLAGRRPRRSLCARVAVAALGVSAAAAVAVAAPQSASAATRTDVLKAAGAYARGSGFTIGISVLDTKTGRLYSAGNHAGTFATESVVKVFIATRLLVSGQMHGTTATRARYMITHSDDTIASSLYGRVGGDSLINWVKAHYHLPGLGTPPRRSGWWGNTHVTSDGLVRLYAKLKADKAVAPWLLSAMHAATKYGSDGTYQFFGLPSATTHPAIKQGWGEDYDDWGRSADFNTTGFVNGNRYAVAILARGPARFYGSKIGAVLTKTARLVLPGGIFPDPNPTMTSVSPTTGSTNGGTTVTVHGHDFTHVTGVHFGAVRATRFRVVSPSTIVAVTPRHSTHPIHVHVVTSHGEVGTSAFTFVSPPAIASVSPAQASTAGGTRVTVHGTSFTRVSRVLFGAVAGTGLKVSSSRTLTVIAPAHAAGALHVHVYTPYGSSRTVTGGAFTFVAPPTVTGVTPAQGSTSGGTSVTVTVTGHGFTAASTVSFGSQLASSVSYSSPTQLTAAAPASSAAGPVDVTVRTVWGTSGTSAADRFTYLTPQQIQDSVPAPTVTPQQGNDSFLVNGAGAHYPNGETDGINHFVYAYDDATALTQRSTTNVSGGGRTSTIIASLPSGTHTLYVASVDALGNRSAVTTRTFTR